MEVFYSEERIERDPKQSEGPMQPARRSKLHRSFTAFKDKTSKLFCCNERMRNGVDGEGNAVLHPDLAH
jgi:hypothetical protein